MFVYLFFTTVSGIVGGIAWEFALHGSFNKGWIIGGIVGIVVGFLFYLMAKSATSRGKVSRKEAVVVFSTQSFFLFVATLGTALIAWVIRLIF